MCWCDWCEVCGRCDDIVSGICVTGVATGGMNVDDAVGVVDVLGAVVMGVVDVVVGVNLVAVVDVMDVMVVMIWLAW